MGEVSGQGDGVRDSGTPGARVTGLAGRRGLPAQRRAPHERAADLTDAFVRSFGHLAAAMPDGDVHEHDGVVSIFSGSGMAPFNVVMPRHAEVDVDAFAAALDGMNARGRPWSVFLRPGHPEAAARAVEDRGLVATGDAPCLVLEDVASVRAYVDVPGLDLDESGAGYEDHIRLLCASFGMPEDDVRRLGAGLFAAPGAALAVGRVGGRAVTTGLSLTDGDRIGVFNIATPAAERRHGYGAAVTAFVALAGLARGGSWAWLQASPLGRPVYERMGFELVEEWRQWMPASALGG